MTDPIDLDRLDALEKAATPGEWAQGYNWRVAGTHPPVAPDRPTCAYCGNGPPAEVWKPTAEELERDGRDPRMEWHRHRNDDPALEPCDELPAYGIHRIEDARGTAVAGNYDYEAGGIIRDEDAKFLIALRNSYPAIAAELRAARAELAAVDSVIGDRGVPERNCTLPLPERVDNIIVELKNWRHECATEAAANEKLRAENERLRAVRDAAAEKMRFHEEWKASIDGLARGDEGGAMKHVMEWLPKQQAVDERLAAAIDAARGGALDAAKEPTP